MAKTWADLLNESRVILQDTVTPYRYSDAVLRAILNRGLQELARLRPDAYWGLFDRDDVVVPEVALLDPDPPDDPQKPLPSEQEVVLVTDPVLLPGQFYTALVYWVVGSAELVDDEYTQDSRAAMVLTQFKAMAVSL